MTRGFARSLSGSRLLIVCVAVGGTLASATSCRRADETLEERKKESQVARRQPVQKPGLPLEPSGVLPEPPTPPAEPSAVGPEPPPEFSYVPPATVEALKKEEIEITGRLIADFPNDPAALVVRGNAYSNHGNSTEATKLWESCLKLDPNRGDVLNCLGWIAQRRGQLEEAVALWRRALETDPTMPAVPGRLAKALMRLGKISEVIVLLEENVKISPENPSSYYLLGQAHLQLKEYEKAKDNYQAAARIDPHHMQAFYGLAITCLRLGQSDQSRQYMEKFKQLKAENLAMDHDLRATSDDLAWASQAAAHTYTDAGRIYRAHANAPKAELLWRMAAALDPNGTACRRELALLYERSHRAEASLRTSEELRELDPKNAQYQLNVGVLNARLGRFATAEEALKKARELAPQATAASRELALLYVRAGRNLPGAMTFAREAVRLDPSAPNYYVLGAVQSKQGDLAAAISSLEQAVALDPRNAQYGRTLEAFKRRK